MVVILDKKLQEEIDQEIYARSNCCYAHIEPESDICSECHEHCQIIRPDKEIMKLPLNELTDDEKERGCKMVNQVDELSQEGFYN